MSQSHIESDPLFQLLTDALRAGPESAEWREAVRRVTERGEAADEFTLLCKARERLAQGREYKSVRPGPTFTRKVMGMIDDEASQAKKGVPWASVIAVISVAVIVGVMVAVAYVLMPAADSKFQSLSGPFNKVVASHTFQDSTDPTTRDRLFDRGSFFSVQMPAASAFAIDMGFDRDFDEDLAGRVEVLVKESTGGQAITVAANQGLFTISTPDGMVVASTPMPRKPTTAPAAATLADLHTYRVRFIINATDAMIEIDGKPLWTGKHQLSNREDRVIGFKTASPIVSIRSIQVLTEK